MSEFNDELIDIDLGPTELHLIEASKGKRFGNYIIDLIVFYAIIFGVAIIAAIVDEDFVLWAETLEGTNWLVERLITAVILVMYFTIVEVGFKGKTIGKFVTGTRVLNYDGTKPEFQTFLLRSLCRIVPFEQFSFLGEKSSGWHDRWTDTIVVDEKLSNF